LFFDSLKIWGVGENLKNLGCRECYLFFDFFKIWGVGDAEGKPIFDFRYRFSRNTIPPKSFLVRCVESQKFLSKRCVVLSQQKPVFFMPSPHKLLYVFVWRARVGARRFWDQNVSSLFF